MKVVELAGILCSEWDPFVVPAIVIPSNEKQREWRDELDPINQLEFVSTKTYLKEFIMFKEDNQGVENV